MSPKIQAVFFDLGDTLVRIKLEIVQKICIAIENIQKKTLSTNDYLIAFQSEWNKRQKPLDKELIKGVATSDEEIKVLE